MDDSDAGVYIGLDLGTSGLKGVALAPGGAVIARGAAAYPTHRPGPEASEQAPQSWIPAASRPAPRSRGRTAGPAHAASSCANGAAATGCTGPPASGWTAATCSPCF